jgi:hypothetical protein
VNVIDDCRRLINAIKPGSVSKINTANIAYLQMVRSTA